MAKSKGGVNDGSQATKPVLWSNYTDKTQALIDALRYSKMGQQWGSNPKIVQSGYNKMLANRVNQYLSQLTGKDASKDQAIPALFNQLEFGKYKGSNPNVNRTIASLPQNTGAGQMANYYNKTLAPQVNDTIQKLYNAADILNTYQNLGNSTKRSDFLESMGFTSAADIYRGLDTYLPKDVSITPDNLTAAAKQMAADPSVFLGNYIESQAKTSGATLNDLDAMIQSANAQGAKGFSNTMTPLQQLIWAYANGGATGLKKNTLSDLGFGANGSSNSGPTNVFGP